MGFVSLPKRTGREIVGVSFSVSGKGKPVWRVLLGGDVLGKMGWKVGDRVAIEVGEGDDLGRLRLAPSAVGRKLGCMGSTASVGLQCPTFPPGWSAQKLPIEYCKWIVEGSAKALIVTLPPALTAAARAKAIAARPVSTGFRS